MKSFFIFCFVLVSSTSVWAASLPKTLRVTLQLDQRATNINLPQIDLAQLKHIGSGFFKFEQTATVTVGAINYDLDKTVVLIAKDESKPYTVDNLKFIRYRFYSSELEIVVGDFAIEMETGIVSSRGVSVGRVTAWY